MARGEGALQTILQLGSSARFAVEGRSRAGQAYVLLRCPAGLSLLTGEVSVLNALATAVMDARAQLLTAAGEGYRCGEDAPDALQRRYTALGLGWRDPIEEDPDRSATGLCEPPVLPAPMVDLSVDGPVWLSAEETAAALGVSLTTLKDTRVQMGLRRHRSGGRFVYWRSEVLAVREKRSVA